MSADAEMPHAYDHAGEDEDECEHASEDEDEREPGVPQEAREFITQMMLDVYGIEQPHEFQVNAIYRLVFNPGHHLCLVQQTGRGKSEVGTGAGMFLGRFVVVVAPLVSVGGQQAWRVHMPEKDIHAIHLDGLDADGANDLKVLLESCFAAPGLG